MVGHDFTNFVAAIVLELLPDFVETKGITVTTYFQSSSLCLVMTIIYYVATFFPILPCILCHNIILDVAIMFCCHLPCPLSRQSFKKSLHSFFSLP